MIDTPLTLTSLCERADVSVRTVRYYIQQGLLPAADRAGPGATYGLGHLDRLRLIRQLKEQHLPLAKIRRRIDGLSDTDVRSLLEGPKRPHAKTAADYVRSVLNPTSASAAPISSSTQARSRAKHAKATISTKPSTRSTWERHIITEDIEVHIRRPLSRDQDQKSKELLQSAKTLFSEDN
jgi:DNA-binding transcriptional MerR regulator